MASEAHPGGSDAPRSRRKAHHIVVLIAGIAVAASGLLHAIVQSATYKPSGLPEFVYASASPHDPLPTPTLERVKPASVTGTTSVEAFVKFATEIKVATVGVASGIRVNARMLAYGIAAHDDASRRRIALVMATRDALKVAEPRSFTAAGVPAVEVAAGNKDEWKDLEIYLFKPHREGVVLVNVECHFYSAFDADRARQEHQELLARCAGVVGSMEWTA